MLELKNIAVVLSGLSVREAKNGSSRFMRLADLSDLKAGRVPVLGRGDAPDVARALTIECGDLIVGARGQVTDVVVASEAVLGAFVSLDLYLVRPDTAKVEPQYLSTFLSQPATQALFGLEKQGTGLPRLPKEALENMKIPLPPLHVQRLIGDLASTVDREGKLLKRLTELTSILGRETVARAFREAETTISIQGVPTNK